MVPRTRTVSCAKAVGIPDTSIAAAPRATPASATTVILNLAFISSSHWLLGDVGVDHLRPPGGIVRCSHPILRPSLHPGMTRARPSELAAVAGACANHRQHTPAPKALRV